MIDRRMRAWASRGGDRDRSGDRRLRRELQRHQLERLFSHAERRRVGLRRRVQHDLERIADPPTSSPATSGGSGSGGGYGY